MVERKYVRSSLLDSYCRSLVWLTTFLLAFLWICASAKAAEFQARGYWNSDSIDGTGHLCGIIRAHRNGSLQRVQREVDVYLIKDGRLVPKTSTDGQGKFALPHAKPGFSTIVACGKQEFAAMAVLVLPPKPSVPAALEIVAASDIDLKQLLSVIVGAYSPSASLTQAGSTDFNAGDIQILSDSLQSDAPDEKLNGTIYLPQLDKKRIDFSQMRVRVYQDSIMINELPVLSDGRYEIVGTDQEHLSLICFGPQGISVTGAIVVGRLIVGNATSKHFHR